MPQGYVIAQINVTDKTAYQTYVAQVEETLAPFGGEFLVRGGPAQSFEGTPHGDRHAVIRFPSVAAAYSWYESPQYAPVKKLRQAASSSVQTIVQGL